MHQINPPNILSKVDIEDIRILKYPAMSKVLNISFKAGDYGFKIFIY